MYFIFNMRKNVMISLNMGWVSVRENPRVIKYSGFP